MLQWQNNYRPLHLFSASTSLNNEMLTLTLYLTNQLQDDIRSLQIGLT